MTRHIELARTEGPKAGFRSYMASNVPTAAARREEIRSAGNSKAQFDAYCALFGDQFGSVKGAGAVRAESQREEVRENGLLSRIAAKLNVSVQDLAKLASDEDEVVEPTSQKREIPAATRISFPMAMALKKIATKQGVKFEITSKDGQGHTADYGVKFDGRKLTPKKASAIIAASKA